MQFHFMEISNLNQVSFSKVFMRVHSVLKYKMQGKFTLKNAPCSEISVLSSQCSQNVFQTFCLFSVSLTLLKKSRLYTVCCHLKMTISQMSKNQQSCLFLPLLKAALVLVLYHLVLRNGDFYFQYLWMVRLSISFSSNLLILILRAFTSLGEQTKHLSTWLIQHTSSNTVGKDCMIDMKTVSVALLWQLFTVVNLLYLYILVSHFLHVLF